MNWPAIFLGCFVVGFVLSVLSFAFGVIDAHVHFPWETHVHVHAASTPAHVHAHRADQLRDASPRSWPGSAAPATCSRTSSAGSRCPAVGLSIVIGLRGAGLVFLLMAQGAVVAEREHAERRLPHGRRPRPPQPADSRRAASAS